MEYFTLQQDERYTSFPILKELHKKIDFRHINRIQPHHLPDTTLFHVQAEAEADDLDVLSTQLFLVSERLKPLIEMYEPDCLFKLIPLIDMIHNKQAIYYLPIFQEIEALSPRSEFTVDRSVIKRLVLQEDKLQGKRIFRVAESVKPLIVVRLEVAESILRRDLVGISLKRVEVDS
ncbi:hypothetical protein LBW89_21980 [Paenibacillus sp. alder61]|nr:MULTISPECIES: DUF1629 domain-containing protein [Paenibacillus]MCA1295681.1 hypothetical protein [Paenibacillus sp. alder61]